MDLDLSGYSTLNSNRSDSHPHACQQGRYAEAAGSHNRRTLKILSSYPRRRRGLATSPALYKASKNLTVPYQASAPFSTWMGKAELVLSAKSCGCCGEPIAATDIPAKTLDLTPKEKVTFRPLFAFVTP